MRQGNGRPTGNRAAEGIAGQGAFPAVQHTGDTGHSVARWRVSCVVEIDAAADEHALRHALAGLAPGDAVRIRVTRNAMPPVTLPDLLPAGVFVQIVAPDAVTASAWRSGLAVIV